MNDSEVIENLRSESEDYKKYEAGHRKLDQSISEFKKKKRPSIEEEIEMKNMQKQKLYFKDLMAQMITQYKAQNRN